VAGTFEPQDPVSAECRRALESDNRVHVTGFMADTPRLYAASDIVTLPTYREGFPNVPLEAASMGLPIVATRVPGCVDAVKDGETGLLVPPRDARALGIALACYLDDATLRARHGAAARARVLRDFRPVRIWEALAEVYEGLVVRRAAATAVTGGAGG
jgi:glycosyltransferase involved in cell wall biosynthesis